MKVPSNVIIRQLAEGSEKIDEMKSEVTWTIRTILGFILTLPSNKRRVEERFESQHCSWEVKGEIGDNRDNYLAVECYSGGTQIFSLWPAQCRHGGPEQVMITYNNLPALVDGLRTVFPGLEEKWKFLVEVGGTKLAVIHSAEGIYGVVDAKDEPKSPTTFRTREKSRLDELAERDGTTVTALVNQAVKEFLERRGNE